MSEAGKRSGALRRRDFMLRGSALLLSPLAAGAADQRSPGEAPVWPTLAIAHWDGKRLAPVRSLRSPDEALARDGAELRLHGLSSPDPSLDRLDVDVDFGDRRLHHAWSQGSAGVQLFVPVHTLGALTLHLTAGRGTKETQVALRLGLAAEPLLTRGTYFIALREPGQRVSWSGFGVNAATGVPRLSASRTAEPPPAVFALSVAPRSGR